MLTSVTAATASGFLDTKIVDGNTLLRIDVDGGANKFVDLVTLQGVGTDLNGLIANAAILGIGTLTATPLTGATWHDTLSRWRDLDADPGPGRQRLADRR